MVDNRLKRRKFVIERGLVEYKKTQAQERKLDKEDRDLLGQLKAFARMLTEGDFKSFSEDLLGISFLFSIASKPDVKRGR